MGLVSTASTITSAEGILAHMEKDLLFAPRMLDMDKRLDSLPEAWRMNTVKAARIGKIWRAEGRQTLAMHPEVVEASRLATSDKIPVEILRALPYINPMVVYPDPPRLDSWKGVAGPSKLMPYEESGMRMLGFMTYSFTAPVIVGTNAPLVTRLRAVDAMVKNTHDPDTDTFGVMVLCEILNPRGKRVDIEATSLSMDFAQVATLGQLVDDQVFKFAFSDGSSKENAKPWFREIFKTVIGSLLYLCSTTLDAEKVPASATRKLASKTIARKPLSLYRVGWTTGAALSRYRRQRRLTGDPSQVGDLAHQQDPQHRRAHFKTVWTGPGRSIPRTAFISPYWTHKERLGESGINTVRRVLSEG